MFSLQNLLRLDYEKILLLASVIFREDYPGGQSAECTQAISLLENLSTEAVLADKAYDTNELREWLQKHTIKAVIPPKSGRASL